MVKNVSYKPCPFCGASPIVYSYWDTSVHARITDVYCPNGHTGDGLSPEVWNKRVFARDQEFTSPYGDNNPPIGEMK